MSVNGDKCAFSYWNSCSDVALLAFADNSFLCIDLDSALPSRLLIPLIGENRKRWFKWRKMSGHFEEEAFGLVSMRNDQAHDFMKSAWISIFLS